MEKLKFNEWLEKHYNKKPYELNEKLLKYYHRLYLIYENEEEEKLDIREVEEDLKNKKADLEDSQIKDIIKKEKDGYVIYSEKGKKLSKPYKTKEEAEKRLRQIEYFKHTGDSMIISKSLLEDKIKKVLRNYLLSLGYNNKDVDDYLVIEFKEAKSEEGIKGIEVQIRNDLVGYYELPDEIVKQLDDIVAPDYFEPYNAYLWSAYMWNKKLKDSGDYYRNILIVRTKDNTYKFYLNGTLYETENEKEAENMIDEELDSRNKEHTYSVLFVNKDDRTVEVSVNASSEKEAKEKVKKERKPYRIIKISQTDSIKDSNLAHKRLNIDDIVHLDPETTELTNPNLENVDFKVTGFWYEGKLINEDKAPEDLMDLAGIQIQNLENGKKYNVNRFQLKDNKNIIKDKYEIFTDEEYKKIEEMCKEYDLDFDDVCSTLIESYNVQLGNNGIFMSNLIHEFEYLLKKDKKINDGHFSEENEIRDRLNEYLEWEGIYNYTDEILEVWNTKEAWIDDELKQFETSTEALKAYLEWEGIIGYDNDIIDIINGEPVWINDKKIHEEKEINKLIKEENEAVESYEEAIDKTEEEENKETYNHILNEELEHIEELEELKEDASNDSKDLMTLLNECKDIINKSSAREEFRIYHKKDGQQDKLILQGNLDYEDTDTEDDLIDQITECVEQYYSNQEFHYNDKFAGGYWILKE